MQSKPNRIIQLLKAAACAGLVLCAYSPVTVQAADKTDPTGTWTWTGPGRNGNPGRKSTLKLKAEGDKVTGKVSSPGRQGAETEIEIADGKIKGDEVSFTVTREANGNKFVSKYNGKVSGDTIKGKVETERNGTPQSRDWEAKREK